MQKQYIKSYTHVDSPKTRLLVNSSITSLAFPRLGLLDFDVDIELYFVARQSKLKSYPRTFVKRSSSGLGLTVGIWLFKTVLILVFFALLMYHLLVNLSS
jgi:hypothetical protein